MKPILPFRHEDSKTYLSKIHPLIRLILPFILVLPFLFINDIYLILTILLITLVIDLIFRLTILEILSRFRVIIPFILLVIIFIPLYVGNTIAYQINIGIKISIYKEGLYLALIIFLRIFTALFVFLSFFSSLTYSEFIEALTKLRIPAVMIGSFIIMIHYIPILASSNKKILEAQEMRGKKITTYWQKLKSHAFVMGKSIIMNMERSERLYESLKMRGFSGKITFAPKKIKFYDLGSLIVSLIIIILLIYFIDIKSIFQGVFSLILP
jgi:cobalt/nickel transport system permease protein